MEQLKDAIETRHSVRRYKPEYLSAEDERKLIGKIEEINKESGLSIQYVDGRDTSIPQMQRLVFKRFGGAINYIVMAGKKSENLEEMCGYYGEQLVLFAQLIGLNTCWIGMFKRDNDQILLTPEEKAVIVIAVGYGIDQGRSHPSKSYEEVTRNGEHAPDWFRKGVEAALLAPTARNQQKFCFEYRDGQAIATTVGGPFTAVDLGIVKCHFELASGQSMKPE
ncbi:MAG: nitroreductase [Lachnospiraceae bacterium]|nr:nitroreductase [Lachnospiraceae bacterium]